ncbi:hypothetical protein N7532_006957 [Penicillium argentinense]|uniref:Uncharacterized protein n=1 Tax=Penicillium argentinense TaxID=1131581 RepID=A0A9W9FGX1_9EURO|nr:uncharacterized protein N7532_006957 [Penicillium argentinense]KAJ5099956.1 hypothetical protein N7532_006957 [Penicillium argentinense]
MARGGPRKKIYTDLATVLILLSTFAGAVTLQTQFALPDNCNGSRARTLVAFSSQFFLTSPIAVFAIFMSLHGYNENDLIEAGRHEFIQCQFALTGIMIIAGFLLLNVATIFTGGNYLGPSGTALMGLFILATIAWGVEDHLPDSQRMKRQSTIEQPSSTSLVESQPAYQPESTFAEFLGLHGNQTLSTPRLISRWSICVLVVLEAVAILVLFGLGIAQAVPTSATGCDLI